MRNYIIRNKNQSLYNGWARSCIHLKANLHYDRFVCRPSDWPIRWPLTLNLHSAWPQPVAECAIPLFWGEFLQNFGKQEQEEKADVDVDIMEENRRRWRKGESKAILEEEDIPREGTQRGIPHASEGNDAVWSWVFLEGWLHHLMFSWFRRVASALHFAW